MIYHGNCADGFSAAWCFWRKYRDSADYHPGVYSASSRSARSSLSRSTAISGSRKLSSMLRGSKKRVLRIGLAKTMRA